MAEQNQNKINILLESCGNNPTFKQIEDMLKTNNFEPEFIFWEGIKRNNFYMVQYIINKGISYELINQAIQSVQPESNIYKLLVNVIVVFFYLAYTPEMIKNLERSIGTKFELIFLEQNNSNKKLNQEEHQELGESMLKSCHCIDQSDDIKYVILVLIDHLMTPSNLLKLEPYLKNKDITFQKYLSGMYEMIITYFVLLNEYYQSLKIEREIKFVDEIEWCFDNLDNPIEKNLVKLMKNYTQNKFKCKIEKNDSSQAESVMNEKLVKLIEDYSQLKQENSEECLLVTLTMEQYKQILKMTYDFDKMIEKINNTYLINLITGIISTEETNKYSSINLEFVHVMIVYHFLMNNELTDYLNKN